MQVADEFVNAAVEIRTTDAESRCFSGGAQLRQRFPRLSDAEVRDIFDVADGVIKLAFQLAGQSLTTDAAAESSAVKRISDAFPVISERTAQHAVKHAFKFWGKL